MHVLDNIACCLTLKLFPSLVSWIGFDGTNYFFSAMSFILTIWGWIAIKTTDGLTLTEIEHIYDQRHRYKLYGENHDDSGISCPDRNQEYSQPSSYIEMVARRPFLHTTYDSGPESLTSLPWSVNVEPWFSHCWLNSLAQLLLNIFHHLVFGTDNKATHLKPW